MTNRLSSSRKEQWHYFVGDIHGCFEEYLEVEAKIYRHAKHNKVAPFVVSVGDMIDRGPSSASVVRHFRKGYEAGTHAAVMGNHEEFLLVSLHEFAPWDSSLGHFPHGLRDMKQRYKLQKGSARVLHFEDYRLFYRLMWITQGGYETLASFGCEPHNPCDWKLSQDDLQFLLKLPLYWQNNQFVVTHALPESFHLNTVRELEGRSDSLEQEQLEDYKDACYQLLWRRPPQQTTPDPERLHISGHTSYNRVRRRKRTQTLQIDTGCVYKKRLTAWCGEDNTFFRVKFKEEQAAC